MQLKEFYKSNKLKWVKPLLIVLAILTIFATGYLLGKWLFVIFNK